MEINQFFKSSTNLTLENNISNTKYTQIRNNLSKMKIEMKKYLI